MPSDRIEPPSDSRAGWWLVPFVVCGCAAWVALGVIAWRALL